MNAGDMAVYAGLVLVGAGSFVAARRYWKELTQDGRSTFELPFGIKITLADSALAIAALGIVLVIVGANFPSRDKTSASDAGQKDLSTKDDAVGLDCSKNRNADLTVNIFSKPARSPDKLKAALEGACFKIHSGPFP